MSLEWWKRNVIYHVYLPSFKDSSGDGIGDINGLISKLDYFTELKVSTLLLSPFYPSPMRDNGYDVSCFTEVDPKFGTMEDFESLIQKIKDRNMNVIVDLVANHTSDLHPWFIKSVEREEPYTDYYIWVDAEPESPTDDPMPPNNWISVFNGSAWTWNNKRKQFYLHQFLPEQPDLNYNNPLVRTEMKKILTFWLEKGVDGFRVDAVSHLLEDKQLRNEPVARLTKAKPGEYAYLNHIYTKGLKGTFDILKEWRDLLDENSRKTRKPKILLTEGMESVEDVCLYYGTWQRKLAEIPLNFQLLTVTSTATGIQLQQIIDEWMTKMPLGKYPNWILSSHDDSRVASRVGSTLGSSLAMVQMLLPGIPIWYYGDELGMEHGKLHADAIKDRTVAARDPMRTPMLWNAERNAGFTDSNRPYLPINKGYETQNVEVQMNEPFSHLENFKKLLLIRNEPSILMGPLQYLLINDHVFSFLRPMGQAHCYIVVINMGQEASMVDLTHHHPLPEYATLVVTNPEHYGVTFATFGMSLPRQGLLERSNSFTYGACGGSDEVPIGGVKVPLNSIYLQRHQGMVLSFDGLL